MVDRAHVLSKFQVAEGMINTERWDHHRDGTSRDGKKIIGQQVTLNTGQTLSGGFSSVAVEDRTIILDNVIAMMDELSDIISDENKEETFKCMIQKMFAVMSDRSSVNKSFNSQLQSYRENLLLQRLSIVFCFVMATFFLVYPMHVKRF